MCINTIRTGIEAVGDYYKTPETKSQAEKVVANLNSNEREVILQIIKESNVPTLFPTQLSRKLQEIHTTDGSATITEKDADLSPFQLQLMHIWRTVKNILGFRISDSKLLKKIEDYSNRADIVNNARADIPELFFTTSDCLDMYIAIVKKTSHFDIEIIPDAEYQTLDLNYTGSSFSLDELESAYRSTLKNYSKDPVRLAAAKKAFQIAYALEEIKKEFIADQCQPLTLKEVAACYRTCTENQKKKLVFLVKILAFHSLFYVDPTLND